MKLNKKDKQWLEETIEAAITTAATRAVARLATKVIPAKIEEAVNKALTVEMTWEKVKDENTGQPLAHKEILKESVFLPAFFCQHLKFHEGSYRGNQETFDKLRTRNSKAFGAAMAVRKQMEILGKNFLGLEQPLKTLALFAKALEDTGLLAQLEQATSIEYLPGEAKNGSDHTKRHNSQTRP